jgi:hypothetical protein
MIGDWRLTMEEVNLVKELRDGGKTTRVHGRGGKLMLAFECRGPGL